MVQHIGELRNLRALHIQKFRNEDTCIWVIKETRKFVIDNLTHYPNLKLEWLCIDDDRVDRIIRHCPRDKEAGRNEKASRDKGKGKVNGNGFSAASPAHLVPSPTNVDDDGDSSDSEFEHRDIQNLKLELVESLQFYEVWGVQIFKKEVMAGRL